ncbi:MAG: restriction endonuclease subunit S, partial [Eubacteriales bacterium]|nr:restriction endonuclease subunit S [Eubacteriales bacterium]
PAFFYYYMKQPMFAEGIKHHSIGTTRQNFPFEAFKMFPMIIPPMELQKRFEEIAKPIEQKIAKLKEENTVLAEIRDTLLQKLMSGELPVEVGEV